MKINDYYNQGREQNRLTAGQGLLEYVRTQRIVQRYLPEPPATIFDIGGAAGIYAFWLAELGYQVHLVDFMPLHIEQALAEKDKPPLASAQVSDARNLVFEDESADVVLLLGPLYHLTKPEDRLQALREAYRVLKPAGVVLVATICRFASLVDCFLFNYLPDPYFNELVEQDLATGQHSNPQQQRDYFTDAYFHYPTEAQEELAAVGFRADAPIAIEGTARIIPNFDEMWEKHQDQILHYLELTESDPTILGISGHIMTIGHK